MSINVLRRKDFRVVTLFSFFVIVCCLAAVFAWLPQSWVTGHQRDYLDSAIVPMYENSQESDESVLTPYVSGSLDPLSHARTQLDNQRAQLFNDAIQLMQFKHHDAAVIQWHKFIASYPSIVEAHVNLGFSFIALKEWDFAKAALEHALDVRAEQANAYYALALIAEERGEWETALGNMRTYLHLRDNDAFASKARAAIWVWEEKIKTSKENK